MLVHIPIYSLGAEDNANTEYCLSLLLVSLRSYYEHGNDKPVLVTTNNALMYDVISAYKNKTRYSFECLYVTKEQIKETFEVDESTYDSDPNLFRFFYSKFYPILKKMDTQIVHIDFDTIFTGKIPFERMFLGNITMMADSGSRFWLNAGVFTVQGGGFELCKKDIVDFYIQGMKFTEPMVKVLGQKYLAENTRTDDEFVFNMFYRYHFYSLPHDLRLTTEFHYNFMAYDLGKYTGWEKQPTIIHFHWYKPNNCRITPDGPVFFTEEQLSESVLADNRDRITPSFYKAILYWFQHLYEVNKTLDGRFSYYLEDVTPELLTEHLTSEFEFEYPVE